MFRFFTRVRRAPQKRTRAETALFLTHKEAVRALVHDRLRFFNAVYGFTYHRVSIKNQRTMWGSCSRKGNLNFNYRILFLPPVLQDYVIVHELCHLKELHHGPAFWALVARVIPDYMRRRQELRRVSLTRLSS